MVQQSTCLGKPSGITANYLCLDALAELLVDSKHDEVRIAGEDRIREDRIRDVPCAALDLRPRQGGVLRLTRHRAALGPRILQGGFLRESRCRAALRLLPRHGRVPREAQWWLCTAGGSSTTSADLGIAVFTEELLEVLQCGLHG